MIEVKSAAPPLHVLQIMQSTWAVDILRSSMELKVYDSLDKGPKSADAIAQERQLSPKGARLLLDAATSLRLLSKSGDKYELTEEARSYLVSTSPLYLGNYFHMHGQLNEAWANLAYAVKSGEPSMQVNQDAKAEEIFPALAEAIFPLNWQFAEQLAHHLGTHRTNFDVRILDLAAGSGVWSLPMARSNKNVTVDALDFPAVAKVTKKFAGKYGVAGQYNYLEGNWRDVNVEYNTYDIILLGHILHSEGKELSRQLLKYCAKALKPGGKLVVAEFLADEERKSATFPLLFAVNMFLATTDGCVFTYSELKEMLSDAGLSGDYRMDMGPGIESPIVIATK